MMGRPIVLSSSGYEFLEHTADAYIAAYGGSLAEAFENAAKAMFDTMSYLEKVEGKDEESLEVSARDEEALLYSWLEELLLRFEIENRLYSRFRIDSIEKTSQGYTLRAKVWGEPFDPVKHGSKTDVKAVTYHRMEILRQGSKVTIKYILDI